MYSYEKFDWTRVSPVLEKYLKKLTHMTVLEAPGVPVTGSSSISKVYHSSLIDESQPIDGQ